MGERKAWIPAKIRAAVPSYRSRVVIIVVGILLGLASIIYTSNLARQLREKEEREIEVWAYAFSQRGQMVADDPFISDVLNSRTNIPFIITDENLAVRQAHLIPQHILDHPGMLERKLRKLASQNNPKMMTGFTGFRFIIFYGHSKLQRTLSVFPFVQVAVIVIFMMFGFITFRSSEEDERNKVWIGLAKETAHQLGTPISSLLGWLEYLRSQKIDPAAVEEMEKDLTRLMKVADRFSKIGSETNLSPANVNEIVGNSVMYFRTRVPKNVTLNYNGFAIAPLKAELNPALFEWVVENLLKNSLDALQGYGSIGVNICPEGDVINIDISDTGKGIPKSNFKRIFEAGFTTKTRGWGLGLSLSKRIIEDYHKGGRIFVVDSEVGKGTTIRIQLKRLYE